MDKNLNELKKSLRFKKFCGNIDSINYEDLDNYNYNYDFADDDEYWKIGSIRTLFKELDSDCYKPIRTDGGFAGRNNSYIEYKSKGDKYENLSPKEYLNVIRPYSRDLINEHKPAVELNNNILIVVIIILILVIVIVAFLLEILNKLTLYSQKVNQ